MPEIDLNSDIGEFALNDERSPEAGRRRMPLTSAELRGLTLAQLEARSFVH